MSTAKNEMNDEPRDPSIVQAYRDAGQPEPPVALDDAIRAAARRALHTRPESLESAALRAESITKRGFMRTWQTPLAAAATLALAVGVAIKVYDTGEANIDAPNKARTATVAVADKAVDQPPTAGQLGEMNRRTDTAERLPSAEPERERAAPAEKTQPAPGLTAGSAASSTPRLGASNESAAVPMAQAEAPRAQVANARRTAPPSVNEIIAPSAPSIAEKSTVVSGGMALESRKREDPPSDRAVVRQEQAAERIMAAPAAPSSRGVGSSTAQTEATAAPSAVAARPRSPDERLARDAEPMQGFALGQRPDHRGMMEDRMAAGSTVSALIAQLATRPADAWFEEIRALKRGGRIADANALLAEFKKRFPNVALPQDLR